MNTSLSKNMHCLPRVTNGVMSQQKTTLTTLVQSGDCTEAELSKNSTYILQNYGSPITHSTSSERMGRHKPCDTK